MIHDAPELTEQLALHAALVPIAVAATFTALVFFGHSIAEWFKDDNS